MRTKSHKNDVRASQMNAASHHCRVGRCVCVRRQHHRMPFNWVKFVWNFYDYLITLRGEVVIYVYVRENTQRWRLNEFNLMHTCTYHSPPSIIGGVTEFVEVLNEMIGHWPHVRCSMGFCVEQQIHREEIAQVETNGPMEMWKRTPTLDGWTAPVQMPTFEANARRNACRTKVVFSKMN